MATRCLIWYSVVRYGSWTIWDFTHLPYRCFIVCLASCSGGAILMSSQRHYVLEVAIECHDTKHFSAVGLDGRWSSIAFNGHGYFLDFFVHFYGCNLDMTMEVVSAVQSWAFWNLKFRIFSRSWIYMTVQSYEQAKFVILFEMIWSIKDKIFVWYCQSSFCPNDACLCYDPDHKQPLHYHQTSKVKTAIVEHCTSKNKNKKKAYHFYSFSKTQGLHLAF